MSRGKTQKIDVQNCRGGLPRTAFVLGKAGFGLMEVMLALFILSFSLLALANLTTVAWRRTYDDYLINLAVDAAANRLEAAFAKDAQTYSNDWQRDVANILPQGQGSYSQTQNGAKAKVCWQQLFHKHKLCYEVEA